MDPKKKDSSTMRKKWFDHVRKTRKKMAKQKREPVSHREAMKEASQSWAVEKDKLLKRMARESRKKAREQAQPKK